MHEVSISPVLMHVVGIDLPPLTDTTVGVVTPDAIAAFMARIPAVTAIRNATVPAVKATYTGVARNPFIAVSAFAPVATSTGRAWIPVVIAGQTTSTVMATSTITAYAPVVTGVGDTVVTAVRANSSADASIPVVSGSLSGTALAVVATYSGAAIAPTAGLSATVNAVVARTNVSIPATAQPPIIQAEIVVTGGGPAGSNMFATPPTTVTGAAPNFVDTFNRANGALGGNWTTVSQFTIVSNAAVIPTNSVAGFAVPVAVINTNDQKVEVVLSVTPTTGDFGQLYVRHRSSPFDAVHGMWDVGAGTFNITSLINGVEVNRGTATGFTFVAGSVISFEVVGTVYTMRLNGLSGLVWTDTGGAVYGGLTDANHRTVAMLYGAGTTGANHGYDSFTTQDI